MNLVTGGDIVYKNSFLMKGALVLCIITICLILVYSACRTRKNESAGTYNQRKTHHHFLNLHGDAYDNEAKQTIKYGEQIKNPTALDHYRLGTAYLVNAGNHYNAHDHFRKALDQVIDGKVSTQDAPFILNKIDDYKNDFIDFPDIEDLPIQAALMAHYNDTRRMIIKLPHNKPENTDPNFTQKIILSRQTWESDSQNVHDSAISSTIKDQLLYVRKCNAQNSNLHTKTYKDMCDWLKLTYENDKPSYEKLMLVFGFFNHNYPIGSIPDINEQDLVTAVWKRAYDPKNSKQFNQIRLSLGASIMDCVEGGHVVCMAGRNAKVWQALAHLDFQRGIGIVKNKQTIRNEIYERSAKIVDDHIGTDGTVSEALKSAYKNAETTEQVAELTECMQNKIEELFNHFNGQIPDTQLRLIIDECKAVV